MDKNVLNKACLGIDSTVSDVIASLEESGLQIVVVVSDDMTLLGLVTDGDIRRGLLRGYGLESCVTEIMVTSPMVVDDTTTRDKAVNLMLDHKIHHIPVVDEHYHLLNLYLLDDEFVTPEYENTLVIMAGGFGKRLMPHTENCPKPMLPIAGKPMLEHILERAISQGFKNFVISVFYLSEVIKDHFKDGALWNVNIEYIQEKSPLGTAGALSLLSKKQSLPIIVSNGDLLTNVGYKEILEYHVKHTSVATMAVRNHETQNPYGVVKTNGVNIVGFEEKPIHHSIVNAGIYVLEPVVLEFLNEGGVCDMPTLFERLKEASHRTVVFPMHERWLDVGKPDDLELASSYILVP